MSGALADEVFDREMPDDLPSPKARDVLLVYALKANRDGTEARPATALVAAKVGCGERWARTLRQYWVAKDVLRLVRRGRKVVGRGNSLPNVYEVHLEVLPLKAQVRPQVERPALVAPNAAGRSDDERERPALRDERPELGDERPALVVPNLSGERPLERPLERPSDSEAEVDEEDPNPDGKTKSAAKKEPRPDVRKIADGIGLPPRPFDPTNPKEQSKRCRICGKFIYWRRTVCPTHTGDELLPFLEKAAGGEDS